MGNWPLRGDGQRFETAGADTSDSTGVTVTSSATIHAKGNYTEIIVPISFDASGFLLQLSGLNAGTQRLI